MFKVFFLLFSWLDSSKSLMEQDIFQNDLVKLRFKYYALYDLNIKVSYIRFLTRPIREVLNSGILSVCPRRSSQTLKKKNFFQNSIKLIKN
jgi:hypothetical protein